MNLEAPPWTADFRYSAALNIFFLDVFLDFARWFFYLLMFIEFSGRGVSGRCVPGLFVCLFFRAWLGMIFAYFVLPTPPAQSWGWSG